MQYKHKNPKHVFTSTKGVGIVRVLGMEIEITQISDVTKKFRTKGIWDTGASSSVITQEVFDHLALKQFGRTTVSTASVSYQPQPTYLIDVYLKPDLCIQAVEVTVGKIANDEGIDCLLGMDIITLGDFAITNFEGNTCMSFRIPSSHEIDYLKTAQAEEAIIQRHLAAKRGMNNPCICGSTKKFKNCHGKDLEEV